MPWTSWQSGWVYTNVGSGEDWVNPANADANQNLNYATLPDAASWSGSKFLWPLSGVIDWTTIVPAGAPITEIEARVFFKGAGFLSAPYRNVTAWLATVGGLQSGSIAIDTNAIGAGGGYRTFGSTLADWSMNGSQLINWSSGGAVTFNVANGGDNGNIGIDSVEMRVCYQPLISSGQAISSSHGMRVGVTTGL